MAAHAKSPFRDSEWGRYMRRVKGARHAHRAIRASGRKPCEEACLAAAARRRAARAERKRVAFEQAGREEQNRMILVAAAEANRAHAERCQAEHRAKMARLQGKAPARYNPIAHTDLTGI